MPKFAIDKKPDGSERRIIEAASYEDAVKQAQPGEIVGQYPDNITETALDGSAKPLGKGDK